MSRSKLSLHGDAVPRIMFSQLKNLPVYRGINCYRMCMGERRERRTSRRRTQQRHLRQTPQIFYRALRAGSKPTRKTSRIATSAKYFPEAKAVGYDPKIMKQVMKLRKMDASDRQEQESLLQVYLDAVGY